MVRGLIMNIYERILNILLEARVEMFIQDRLDERSDQAKKNKAMKRALTKRTRDQEAPPAGRSGRIALSPGEGEAADDHAVRMAGARRTPTDDSEAVAVGRRNLKLPRKDTFRSDEAKKVKPSQVRQASSKFSEPNLGAKALTQAGAARRAGNKSGAEEQLARAKKLDKPQLP